jgi:hypothetical protein
LAAPGLDRPVRKHDEEVDHRQEDDEVDDRGYKAAEIYQRLGSAGPDLLAQSVLAGLKALNERVDDVGGEGGDQCAEREGYDQAHRDDDHVAAHQEVLESPHVLFSDPLDVSGWVDGLH